MLKMVIADDELIVRNGLRKILPWRELGIEIIGEAANGKEALELCMQLCPDILFTDIRMPLMDGLEVAMKLREEGNDIKIIILSGIQDFNFVKTALNINAEGYILKPIKINELKEVIKKVIHNISMERNKEQKMEQLMKQLQENMMAMREKFLRNLFAGFYSSEHEVKEKLEYYKISLNPEKSMIVSIIQIDDYSKIIEKYSEEDKQLLDLSVNNILDEIMTNYDCGFGLLINENEFIIVFNQKAQNNKKCIDICEDISTYINRFLGISVSIGIGHSVDEILQLSSSYKSAKVVLQYRFYSGKGSVLSIKDINNITDSKINTKLSEYSKLHEAENRLVSHVQLGDTIAVKGIINEIFDFFYFDEEVSEERIHYFCMEIRSIASRAIFELGENVNSFIVKRSVILDTIYKTENVFNLKNYLVSLFSEIAVSFSKSHKKKNGKVIEKIRQVIQQRYMEDIDVKAISNEVYLSPNYLSFIYKRETGETIIEYLTKVRMEMAKDLLKTSDLKVCEISERVGFASPYYFSVVFKKYTGINPLNYRTSVNS